MKKIVSHFLALLILTQSFGQTAKNISIYLLGQYNQTRYDRTMGNNPWATGLGVQAYFNNKTKFKPTVEITWDAYRWNDDVFRINPDGSEIPTVNRMVNVFVGASYNPSPILYLSLTAGPSFIGGNKFFGLKPSIGFNFLKNQRLTTKVSFINIFNRDKTTKQDFGSVSFSLGVKLF